MSDHDREPDPEVEPLAGALRDLLAPEHDAGSAPGKERVRARLDASLFGGPPGGGDGNGGQGAPNGTGGTGEAAASSLARLARVGAIFASGAIVGGIAVAALMPPRIETVERIVQPPATVGSSSASASDSARAPTITHPIESAPASASSTPAVPPPIGDTLAQERAILDTARTAIGRRDGASALEAVRRHEAKHPSGKLVEEREAIAVQALVLTGRNDEARTRATKFLARWPDSVLAPTVRAAIGN